MAMYCSAPKGVRMKDILLTVLSYCLAPFLGLADAIVEHRARRKDA